MNEKITIKPHRNLQPDEVATDYEIYLEPKDGPPQKLTRVKQVALRLTADHDHAITLVMYLGDFEVTTMVDDDFAAAVRGVEGRRILPLSMQVLDLDDEKVLRDLYNQNNRLGHAERLALAKILDELDRARPEPTGAMGDAG